MVTESIHTLPNQCGLSEIAAESKIEDVIRYVSASSFPEETLFMSTFLRTPGMCPISSSLQLRQDLQMFTPTCSRLRGIFVMHEIDKYSTREQDGRRES